MAHFTRLAAESGFVVIAVSVGLVLIPAGEAMHRVVIVRQDRVLRVLRGHMVGPSAGTKGNIYYVVNSEPITHNDCS